MNMRRRRLWRDKEIEPSINSKISLFAAWTYAVIGEFPVGAPDGAPD